MKNINYDSPAEIRAFLESREWNTRKKWGQNFLINRGAREKITKALDLQPEEVLWEIGPGLGAMTEMIRPLVKALYLFEIDPGYQKWLGELFEGDEAVHIIGGDVLKTWQEVCREEGAPDKVVGNLPYNAASAIITSFIREEKLPRRMVITVQKEMGERMTARPSTSQYSSFSVLCQAACRVESKGVLKPGSFFPVPRVSSIIISLEASPRWQEIQDPPYFMKLIRALFSSRRKTLRNNALRESKAGRLFTAENFFTALQEMGIGEQQRAETLTVEQYIELAGRLSPDAP